MVDEDDDDISQDEGNVIFSVAEDGVVQSDDFDSGDALEIAEEKRNSYMDKLESTN